MEAYTRYGRALLRKAERVLRNRDDALDVVQSLFQDLYETKRHDVDLPYLYRAVTNRCLSLLRDERNRARLLAENDASLMPQARGNVERLDDLELLKKLVRTLDDETSEILVLHYFDDLPQEEIAAVVGLSRKTVGKRLETIRETACSLQGAPS